MQELMLCNECQNKLEKQPVEDGVILGMAVEELCDECRKSNQI